MEEASNRATKLPQMPGRVVHWKQEPCDVRIDRSGPWGNPFTHLDLESTKARWNVGTRQEAIEAFEWWVESSDDPEAVWIREHVGELSGLTLGCWCAPQACHGDVLVRLAAAANPPKPREIAPRDPADKIKRRRLKCRAHMGKGDHLCPRCGWATTHLTLAYWPSPWNQWGGMCVECCIEAAAKFDREDSWPDLPEPEGDAVEIAVAFDPGPEVAPGPAPLEEQQGFDI